MATRLKNLRKRLDCNAGTLARLIGVHEMTIRRWESPGVRVSPGLSLTMLTSIDVALVLAGPDESRHVKRELRDIAKAEALTDVERMFATMQILSNAWSPYSVMQLRRCIAEVRSSYVSVSELPFDDDDDSPQKVDGPQREIF